MKKLVIVYFVAFLSLLTTVGCGRVEDNKTASVTPSSPTKFVMNDEELCNELRNWKMGASNQIVAPTQGLAFYDSGVFKIDFLTPGQGELITDAVYELKACKITIQNGAVSTTFPVAPVMCGGWFQPPCQNNNFGGMQ